MYEAVARTLGHPPPPDVREFLAEAPSLEGVRTVVEVAGSYYSSPEHDPRDELSRFLERCVDALAELCRAIRVTVMAPFEIVSLSSLPPFVLCDVHVEGETAFDPGPWFNRFAALPHRELRTLTEAEFHEVESRHRERTQGIHSHVYREAFAEALVSLHIRGDTAAAVIWAHVAVEVLLDALLMSLMWETGNRPREAAEVFKGGLRERVRATYQQLLGGDWNLETGPMAVWASPSGLARLRGRVVHMGYRPSHEEARNAVTAIKVVEAFLMARLRERRVDYPRTTMLFIGGQRLSNEGLFTGRFRDFIELEANLEPLWTRELANWTNHTNRVREAGGGLTGAEESVVYLDDKPSLWLWDPADGSVCPMPAADLPQELVDRVVELIRSLPGTTARLIHVPGLIIRPANEAERAWGSPHSYGLPDPPNRPTPVGLDAATIANHAERDSLILAAVLLSVANQQLGLDNEISRAEDTVMNLLGRLHEISDDHAVGHVAGAAGAFALLSGLSAAVRRSAFDVARQRLEPTSDRAVFANATFESAMAASQLGELTEAMVGLRTALRVYRQIGDLLGEARATGNLGTVEMQSGNYDESQRLQLQAAAQFEAMHDLEGLAKTHVALARLKLLSGRREEAGEHYENAAHLFVTSYEPLEAVDPVALIAAMAIRDDHVPTAVSIIRHASGRFQPLEGFEFGSRIVERVYAPEAPWEATGDVDTGVVEATRQLQSEAAHIVAGQMLIKLAERSIELGNLSRAEALAADAENSAQAAGSTRLRLDHLDIGARTALGAERYGRALELFDEYFETALQDGNAFLAAHGAIAAATASLNAGDTEGARQWLGQAERHAPETEHAMRAWLLALDGAILEHEGDTSAAEERWRRALDGLAANPPLRRRVEGWLESGTGVDDELTSEGSGDN
jgi:tetratricopeptide (TPR) repeat protein